MTEERIERHRRQLLAKGYNKELVKVGIEWATGSARGMAQHATQSPSQQESLFNQLLDSYLREAEVYIKKMAE